MTDQDNGAKRLDEMAMDFINRKRKYLDDTDVAAIEYESFTAGYRARDERENLRVQVLVEALVRISIGHERGCGVNEGCRCTCVAQFAAKALAAFRAQEKK